MTDTGNLVPRRYQEEILVQAQKGNIIAALDTGSGKTLISRMLILWVSIQPSSKGKAIIFLVPRVTLVAQQAAFLADRTSLRVMQLYGALEMDLTDRKGWKKKFNSCDVFVMTPQIFLNLITHSLWRIDKVSLMVFDECHHARKSHPYNSIMREYFHVNPISRPKIFGMTASPIWNPKEPQTSLATLEANLDAKVIGVREHVDELKQHAPKPTEELWELLDIPWINIQPRYYSTYYHLGPYCASLFLYFELQIHFTRIRREYRPVDEDVDMEDASIIPNPIAAKTLPADFFDIEDIVSGYESFFVCPTNPLELPIAVPLEWCTPKLRELVNILLAYRSETFQAIIFVEQRQVAACLSKVLPYIPELTGVVRSAYLVGQGASNDGVSRTDLFQGDAVKLFREGKVNILIATSVAEEGLDFPACDVVVRYDPLQHMVGYVQSRGRARNKASTFIIMIQENDITQLARYKALQDAEPEVKQAYQKYMDNLMIDEPMDEASDQEDIDPMDIIERERFVVPSTGAILTYDNSLDLLGRLCSLIPRDIFTPVYKPKYTGSFEVLVELPAGLPLPPSDLGYYGPLKRTKKEAKRAAAFHAVKRLYELNVFDEYLLPITDSPDEDDVSGWKVDMKNMPNTMTVSVVDPWVLGPKLWLHYVLVDGRRVAGLITGTSLPCVNLRHFGLHLQTEPGKQLAFSVEQRHCMKEFTNLGIWYRITGSPHSDLPSLYIVPLTTDGRVDFKAIDILLLHPNGCVNWDIAPKDDIFVSNINEIGRLRKLVCFRHDISTASKPPPGSREDGFDTYYNFFVYKWTRKKRYALIPHDGPMLETIILPRCDFGAYNIYPSRDEDVREIIIPNGGLIPLEYSRWIPMSADVLHTFELLPVLCRRITDLYRIQRARMSLSLPSVYEDVLIEALTLPCVAANYSNQRLETLGDAVLELCTTVHLYNKYPTRHEGQLTKLRKQVISNRYLLARAKRIGLEQFITSEILSVFKWRYVLSSPEDRYSTTPTRRRLRDYPRRSLQDCMEALLGASFHTGGIPMALQMGTAMDLEFGGVVPWSLRYVPQCVTGSIPSLFSDLQIELGYNFKSNRIILEALTHPSFASPVDGPSYQRLEFLGDALLDLVVVKYLYDKFPNATSHQLAFPRTKAICAPALAWLAVRKLHLYKVLLVNNVELSAAIEPYIPLLESTSAAEIVNKGWRYDPPKVVSDIFESVMGAVLIDSGYNYELAAAVVEHAMEDVLSLLSPSVAKDPVSELTEWAGAFGCTKLAFSKVLKEGTTVRYGISILVHDHVVVGPIVSASIGVAKFVAAERALAVLRDSSSNKHLSCFCECSRATDVTPTVSAVSTSASVVNDDFLEVSEAEEVHNLLVTTGNGYSWSSLLIDD
ncbi:type III restriction enzyme [Cyathus striatus]|nr:type III restriction enzyme [Cyathus striatus]